jgi:glutamine amidotransferase-like uncharacterized protein
MKRKLVVALSVVVLVLGLLPIDPVFSNEAPQAYGVRVGEENWTQAYQLINVLLRSGIPVYLTAEFFDVDGITFEPGDFLVPVSAMPIEETALDVDEAESLVNYLSHELDVDVVPIVSEIEVDVYVLKPIKIALYGGQSGLPTPYAEVFSTLGFKVEYVSESEIMVGRLISDGYDVLTVPGDGSTGELVALGEDGGDAVQEFVANGGGYISSCAGSWAAAMGSLGWDESFYLQLINAKNWNVVEGYAGAFRKLYPGKGVMVFENINPDHPVMWGIPETFEMVWWQGPIFEVVSSALMYPSTAERLVVNQAFTDSFTAAEYYSDLLKQKREGFKDTVAYKAISQGKPVVVSGTYGKGKVVLFGPHPEFKTELTLNGFQYVPARMIANSVLWEASEGPYVFTTQKTVSSLATDLSPLTRSGYTRISESATVYRFGLDRVLEDEETIRGQAEQLNQMYVENSNPSWLSGLQSSWGLTPKQEFEYNIQEIPKLCVELETACVYTNQIVAGLMSAYADLSSLENGLNELRVKFNVEDLLDEVREAKIRVVYSLRLINDGISMVQGPTTTYGGTEGVLNLTSKAVVMMETAIVNYNAKKTTSSTEPLANIGTYGAAGCIVHALNTLRGRSSYANGELGYAGYAVEKVAYELAELRTLVTNEDLIATMEGLKAADEELMGETEELKAGNEDLKRQIEESTELLEKQISQVYIYATVVGIVSAIVTSAVIYVLMRWKKVV